MGLAALLTHLFTLPYSIIQVLQYNRNLRLSARPQQRDWPKAYLAPSLSRSS